MGSDARARWFARGQKATRSERAELGAGSGVRVGHRRRTAAHDAVGGRPSTQALEELAQRRELPHLRLGRFERPPAVVAPEAVGRREAARRRRRAEVGLRITTSERLQRAQARQRLAPRAASWAMRSAASASASASASSASSASLPSGPLFIAKGTGVVEEIVVGDASSGAGPAASSAHCSAARNPHRERARHDRRMAQRCCGSPTRSAWRQFCPPAAQAATPARRRAQSPARGHSSGTGARRAARRRRRSDPLSAGRGAVISSGRSATRSEAPARRRGRRGGGTAWTLDDDLRRAPDLESSSHRTLLVKV